MKHLEQLDIDQICNKYYTKVLNYFVRKTGKHDVAQDLTQDTFVKVIKHLPDFRGECQVLSWLYGIAYSVLCNNAKYRRAKGRDLCTSISNLSDEEVHEDFELRTPCDSAESIDMVRKLSKLNTRRKDIIYECITNTGSYTDIAVQLGVAEGTVKSSASRIKDVFND